MGVTDPRPYFTQIIGNNSMHVHRIPTKLGTEIRLNEPFMHAKFQPDWSTNSCFMADFAKCAKRRRKPPKLWPLVFRKWLERFSSDLECGLPYLAILAWPDRFFRVLGGEKRVWCNSNSCLLLSLVSRGQTAFSPTALID